MNTYLLEHSYIHSHAGGKAVIVKNYNKINAASDNESFVLAGGEL